MRSDKDEIIRLKKEIIELQKKTFISTDVDEKKRIIDKKAERLGNAIFNKQ